MMATAVVCVIRAVAYASEIAGREPEISTNSCTDPFGLRAGFSRFDRAFGRIGAFPYSRSSTASLYESATPTFPQHRLVMGMPTYPIGSDELADRRLERFLVYWRALPKMEGIAARGAIDLADCRAFAPYLLAVDVLGPELDFRARLAGTEVVERFGLEFAGRRMSELSNSEDVASLFLDCAIVVEHRVPRCSSKLPGYRRIICPVAGKGGGIELLIGIQVAVALP